MPSDGADHMIGSGTGPSDGSFGTGGAVARRRALRLALLAALVLILAIVSYSAWYFTQNRRLPSITVTPGSEKLAPPQFLYSFAGSGDKAMTRPVGIGIIGDRVFVTDFAWRTVRAYSTEGDYLFDVGPVADAPRQRLDSPVHIAIGPGSTVWVTDRTLKGVYIFDQDGTYLRKFVPDGNPDFDWSPLAIAFSADGDVFISDVGDSEKHQVFAFGTDGTLKAQWGTRAQVNNASESPGGFNFPNGLAVFGTGANARVYVADGGNRRVQVFRTDGTFVSIISTSGNPRGLAVDAEGRVWVVDVLAHLVDLYSPTGALLVEFGSNGTGPGQFNFPNDIAIDGASGRLFLTDQNNNQVQVWGFAVGEIPGVTQVSPASAWLLLIPGALLLLPFLLRRRRFVATPDFVDAMIAADLVPRMVRKRWRWVMREEDAALYEGRVVDGVALGDLLVGEPYSMPDAQAIRGKLSTTLETAGLLAMAKHYRVLCTQDPGLASLAAGMGIDVYDRATWLEHFSTKRS